MPITLKTFRLEQLNNCIKHCKTLFPTPPSVFEISTLSNISHKDVAGLTKIVEALKKHMGINFKTKVTITDDGPENGAAWINAGSYKPLSDGKPDLNFIFEIGIRPKSLSGKKEPVIKYLAHELSHLKLYVMNHELKNSEIMTDVFCIFSGFGDLYYLFSKDHLEDLSKLPEKLLRDESNAYSNGESNYVSKAEQLYAFAQWKTYYYLGIDPSGFLKSFFK